MRRSQRRRLISADARLEVDVLRVDEWGGMLPQVPSLTRAQPDCEIEPSQN